jgi:hypothetical protein
VHLICVNAAGCSISTIVAMSAIPIWKFFSIVAMLALGALASSIADAHVLAGGPSLHFESSKLVAQTKIDCASLVCLGHRACPGTSEPGCCIPCLIVPAEPGVLPEISPPAFSEHLADAATGIPAPRLKRPPRLAL